MLTDEELRAVLITREAYEAYQASKRAEERQKQEREAIISDALKNLKMVRPKEVRRFFRTLRVRFDLLDRYDTPHLPRVAHYVTLRENMRNSRNEAERVRDEMLGNYGCRFACTYYDFNGYEINPYWRENNRVYL